MRTQNSLALALAAGCIANTAIAQDVHVVSDNTLPSEVIGHIYFNIATGERIATSLGDSIRPVDAGASTEVWIAAASHCSDFGQSTGTAVVIDAPNGEGGFPTREGDVILDWGDIEADSIIDCLQIDFFSAIGDTDTNSDGIGDGVVGFAATWSFFDADNGFDSCFDRTGLIGFTLFNLPGEPSGKGNFGGYNLTLDLVGSFTSSLAFEIGDTDSSTDAINNPMINADTDSDSFGQSDIDSDGLADWSMSIQYIQPGRQDVDNADSDSDTQTGIDGVFSDDNITAVALAAPVGTVIDNGDGTWSLVPDTGIVNAFGAEDAYDIFDATGFYTGSFNQGGFSCLDPSDGTVNAFAQIQLTLFGPDATQPCAADLVVDGTLDGFDVFEFIALFNAQDQLADFVDDDIWDGFDVFEFIAQFNAGCP